MIVIVPYQREWPEEFERLGRALRGMSAFPPVPLLSQIVRLAPERRSWGNS